MTDCIFCKIVQKKSPAHIIWEDANHMAFLSIYPNTEGVTVVIPKKHYPSYIFDLDEGEMMNLLVATKRVAKLLDTKLKDVGRTALVFEGFGVDHVHAKLFPMHETAELKRWKPIKSHINKYFDKYEGYISSHDGERADDTFLKKLVKQIHS